MHVNLLSPTAGDSQEPPAVVTPALHQSGIVAGGTEPLCGLDVSRGFLPHRAKAEFHTRSDVGGQVREGKGGSVHFTSKCAMRTVVLHECTSRPSTGRARSSPSSPGHSDGIRVCQ